MRECLFNLIDQDQAQVTGVEALQGQVDGLEFAGDVVDALGPAGVGQAVAQQADDFAVGAAALAGVLVEDNVVEGKFFRCATAAARQGNQSAYISSDEVRCN